MDTLCDGCRFKALTWSEELTEKGFIGCAIMLDPHISLEDKIKDEQDWFDYIDTPAIGFGWIEIGGMCYNEQPILMNGDVKKCSFYEGKR